MDAPKLPATSKPKKTFRSKPKSTSSKAVWSADDDCNLINTLLEEREKLAPSDAIGGRVRILRRIPAGGVEKDRFVGEPPVAIPCAADTAKRAFADTLFQRKLQS